MVSIMQQDIPQQEETSIIIYGDFKITLVPMKELFLGFNIENPQQTGYLEVGVSKIPIYNNYLLHLNKGVYVPIWMNFFVSSPSTYDVELEKLLYGMYQKWFESVKRNKKDNPKITNIKISRSDKNDLLSFNIAYWTAVFLKVKKDIVDRTIGKAWPQFWKIAGKDYGNLLKLSGYAVYPLRYYINMLINKLSADNLLIYNILTLTKRQYPPLIRIPNYPIELPYLPPIEVKEQHSREYDSFELSLSLFENLTNSRLENDKQLYHRVKKELMGNSYYHTTFYRLKSFNILSTINPYHAKKILFWDNGTYKIIDYIQIKKYEKPESFYTFKKNYLNKFLNTYFETGKLPYDENGFISMVESDKGYKYITLKGTIIDVWSNGGVVFELGVNNYDDYNKTKTVVVPSELLTTVKVRTRFYTETYPAVQVGKLKILLKDDFTNPLSYAMVGTWGRALRRNTKK